MDLIHNEFTLCQQEGQNGKILPLFQLGSVDAFFQDVDPTAILRHLNSLNEVIW